MKTFYDKAGHLLDRRLIYHYTVETDSDGITITLDEAISKKGNTVFLNQDDIDHVEQELEVLEDDIRMQQETGFSTLHLRKLRGGII